MSTAISPSTAKRHFTPEQIEGAIHGVVRRSTTDEDEASLIAKRMRRVMSGEATVEEVSRGSSVFPKHVLEAHVKAARIALEHIVDGIAEAIA
ncbi:hypothetical protein AAVH_11908 [Aphelenchoides avenae]|nr:hypothetical protein AAVH_11908 [Aphelenchus avenae]